MNSVTIWTDGSCWPNPGPGAWAAVIERGGCVQEIHGAHPERTTNNRMEILAVIEGLRHVQGPSEVTVFSDSEYVLLGARKCAAYLKDEHYKIGPRAKLFTVNRDLWLDLACAMRPHIVAFKWVRGHAECANNCRADYLAEQARKNAVGCIPTTTADSTPTPRMTTARAKQIIEHFGGDSMWT